MAIGLDSQAAGGLYIRQTRHARVLAILIGHWQLLSNPWLDLILVDFEADGYEN